jgi:hypothetical protein
VWRGTIELPPPESPYTLPGPFKPRLPDLWLPWHFEHERCVKNAMQKHLRVPSFVVTVLYGDIRTIIPMEETLMSDCALSALAKKLALYLPQLQVSCDIRELELKVNRFGKRSTLIVDFEHGLIAQETLMEWFERLEDGDLVTIKVEAKM